MFSGWIGKIKWLLTRVGIIYGLLFLFIIFCVDLKLVENRNKARRLNGTRPDFTDMVKFAKYDQNKNINWVLYKNYFELVLKYVPEEMAAKEVLGYVYYQMGQEGKAISLFQSTSKFNSVLFWPNYNLGVIYFKKGMYKEAYEYLTQAISSKPEVIGKFMLGDIIYRQIFANSSFDVNLQSQINDSFSSAYVLTIASLARMKLYQQMLMVSGIAMSHTELSYQEAFNFYAGLACMELNQPAQALAFLNRSLSFDRNNPLTYYYLSQLYKALGKEEEAVNTFRLYEEKRNANKTWIIYDQRINVRFF